TAIRLRISALTACRSLRAIPIRINCSHPRGRSRLWRQGSEFSSMNSFYIFEFLDILKYHFKVGGVENGKNHCWHQARRRGLDRNSVTPPRTSRGIRFQPEGNRAPAPP